MKNIISYLLVILFFISSSAAQNTAVQLDGNSEYITVPHKDNQNIADNFTVEAWIFANEWTSEIWRGSIVNKDNQGPDRGFGFRCGDNGKLSFVIAVDNSWFETFTPALMNVKQWHHVAGVVSNSKVKLYVDGQEVASNTFDGIPSALPEDLYIGASTGFEGRNFNGIIDEVRIWQVARTQQQIADASTMDLSGGEDGLALYLPMNDGSGSTISNLVDANCNGVGVGVGDDNWVDGYTLPDFDVSVQAISGLDRINMKTRPIKISVIVQNVGTNDIDGFDINISVDGEIALQEAANVSVPAGSVIEYTLLTPLDLTENEAAELEATVSHPEDANSLNNTTSISVDNSQGNTVQIFNQRQHNFGGAGQNHFSTILLPTDLSEYVQILLHISLECPSTGCDPWDQPAKITAVTPKGNFEIARYITPYGKGCGPWTIDVTDFKDVLGGKVDYNSYIQVWGSSGWLANAELEFVEGEDDTPFSKMTTLWNMDYQVYGDPNISHDITPTTVVSDPISESSHIRMQVTGHGQGNTNNAAEFYNVTHSIKVDNTMIDEHHLWKDDCATNSCDDQAGTWLFSRAGWCPGQEVQPSIFDTSDKINPGTEAAIDYVLQDYTNQLNTGYNDSGHTEPHYRLHGFFVEESSERYEELTNLRLDVLTVDESGSDLSLLVGATNTGSTYIGEFTLRLFVNNIMVIEDPLSFDLDPGEGGAFDIGERLTMLENDGAIPAPPYVIVAEASYDGDENPGDNLLKTVRTGTVSAVDLNENSLFEVNPNPSSREIQIDFGSTLFEGQLFIYTSDGQLVNTLDVDKQTINNQTISVQVENQGAYLLKAIDLEGTISIKKVIVIE